MIELAVELKEPSMIVTALVCLSLSGCQASKVDVLEGDSFVVSGKTYRLTGVDAAKVEGACAAESTLGRTARAETAMLVRHGRVVVNAAGFDRKGRTLAAVSVDGVDLGRALVEKGLAHSWNDKRSWCR
jgi:endonuclease YncB( thermonuclease family)